MSAHSFRFFYNSKFYYPVVEAINKDVFNIHLYESLEEFSLPQSFQVDISSDKIDNNVLNERSVSFLQELKLRLVEHLIAIKVLETSLRD